MIFVNFSLKKKVANPSRSPKISPIKLKFSWLEALLPDYLYCYSFLQDLTFVNYFCKCAKNCEIKDQQNYHTNLFIQFDISLHVYNKLCPLPSCCILQALVVLLC